MKFSFRSIFEIEYCKRRFLTCFSFEVSSSKLIKVPFFRASAINLRPFFVHVITVVKLSGEPKPPNDISAYTFVKSLHALQAGRI